jgi:hypothetical protein
MDERVVAGVKIFGFSQRGLSHVEQQAFALGRCRQRPVVVEAKVAFKPDYVSHATYYIQVR